MTHEEVLGTCVCRDGQGYRCERPCTGYLVSPQGDYRQASCREHGEQIAAEYRFKLNEPWVFQAVGGPGVLGS